MPWSSPCSSSQGAWPTPEVNEPNYLGKAIHFWNPAWGANDFFLGTADTHWVFYFTFGWLSRWLGPTALAWFGRTLTWVLLAWAWRRLSFAVAPRPWLAPVTAALLAAMIQHGNLAGEWIIGGVEAKGFAFVLVFLALEALARDRWNRAWLLLGAASAFHVLVGGWATLATAIVWALSRWEGRSRCKTASRDAAVAPPLRSLWLGLAGGLILSLPGLVPALLLNAGADAATARRANMIYVYERLPHHLDLWKFPLAQLVPFAVLCVLWLILGIVVPDRLAVRRIRSFTVASLMITLAGMLLSFMSFWNPSGGRRSAAVLLVSPVRCGLAVRHRAVGGGGNRRPAGKPSEAGTLFMGFVIVSGRAARRRLRRHAVVLRAAALQPFWDLDAWTAACRWLACPGRTPIPLCQPRGDRLPDYPAWLDVCDWASRPEHLAAGAVFLTPRMSQSFKWHTGRSEAGTWKEVPQDARGIVEWRRRMDEFCSTRGLVPGQRWFESPAELGVERLRELAAKERIDYVLAPPIRRFPCRLRIATERISYIECAPRSERKSCPLLRPLSSTWMD